MELYYMSMCFIFGIVLGSFYNVVGYRVPKHQSLIYPSSHCTTCNHKLGASELVPVFSYLFQKGKCKHCGAKISLFYPLFELTTGILFSLSYYVYGFGIPFFISIVFISMLLIVIISDYQMMIIPDEVLISSSIILLILKFLLGGGITVLHSLIDGVLSFSIMFLLKKLGDFLFKKESMGGGDIKLLFTFGLVFGWQMSIVSIFMASFIALPFAIYYTMKYKNQKYVEDDEIPENSIPFGPFLAVSAILITLTQMDISMLLQMFM